MSIELTHNPSMGSKTTIIDGDKNGYEHPDGNGGLVALATASSLCGNGDEAPLEFGAAAAAAAAAANSGGAHNGAHNGGTGGSAGERLSVAMLATIVFYNVSGGPFGCEGSIRAGGNFYTLLGFLIMPLVWSIPEALMTAELASTFPEAAGGAVWVEEAFGNYAGWMTGFLGWVSGATDNAIYPVLFLEYVLQLKAGNHRAHGTDNGGDAEDGGADQNLHPVLRFLVLSAVSILLAFINWMGLRVVGRMSLVICFVAMSPFMILALVGVFKVQPSRWFDLPTEDLSILESVTDDDISGGLFPSFVVAGVMWRPFLNNLFWSLNSFDAAASFSEDVDDPGKVYPVAMRWSVIMVVTGYLVPLLVALGASSAQQHEWVDGYFATVATEVVGPWLGDWTVFAAGISNIALFQAELSTEAFQLMGMAERGYVPKIFAQRSRHGTPTYGILLGTAVIVLLGTSDLAKLIEMLNFNYAIALLLEYCAFLKLRITRPELHRPWRVPLNTVGCILLFVPTFAFTLTLMSLATYTTYAFSIAVNTVGMLLYMAQKRGFWGSSNNNNKGTYDLVHEDSAVVVGTDSSDSDDNGEQMEDGDQMDTDHQIT